MPRSHRATLSPDPSTDADRVIAFIERYCRAPEGKLVGKPLQLLPFQSDFIRAIYDNPQGTRRAYLSIARKNGKTALTASLLLAHLVGPMARQNSQIISGAMSRDQAGLVFNLASKMVMMSDELRDIVRVVPSTKRLIGLPMNVEYRALAADGKTAHGLSPVLAILDETGQVRGPNDDFIDAIVTSQGAHDKPLLIAISTQAASDDDLFSLWLDDAEKSKNPRVVSHVYAAAPDADLQDVSAWKDANPALGDFRSLDDMAELAQEAARMPTAENTFRNLFLNQRVSTHSPFVSKDVWRSCGDLPEDLDDSMIYVGLDLSQKTDLTAMIVVQNISGTWQIHPYFWTPEQGLEDRVRRDRAPYDVWVRQGYLKTTPGASIDYRYVIQEMMDAIDGRPHVVAFDRWRMDQFKLVMSDMGAEFSMEPFGQGFKDMSPAVDRVEELLLNRKIRHGNHPVLTMCMANASVTKDPAGNRKLDKQKSTGRIDGAVALCMALGVEARHEREPEPEYKVFFI